MINGPFKKIKTLIILLKNSFSTKKNFMNFLLAYFILRYEVVRIIVLKVIQLKVRKSPHYLEVFEKKGLSKQLDELKERGNVVFNKTIPELVVENIKNQITHLTCRDPYKPEAGTFKFEDAPPSAHIAGYDSCDLVKIPEIMQIANDAEILALAQEYFGCTPTITGVEMWWSLIGRTVPQYAQLFHRDFDGVKFLKLFIYLTDVDANNGPHMYVANSIYSHTRRPARFTDKQIAVMFHKERIMRLCGKKGCMFIEDTFGLHKGTLPRQNNRLLLQIEYGVHPLVYKAYKPISEPAFLLYEPYVNRLFMDLKQPRLSESVLSSGSEGSRYV